MPKQKTNKSAAKRFKKTARGKVRYRHPNTGHLMQSKSSRRRRHLRKGGVLSATEAKRIIPLLG